MRSLARAVWAAALVSLAVAAPAVRGAAAPAVQRWDVTVAVRLSGGDGKPFEVEIALPADTPARRISEVVVSARGLKADVVRDRDRPHVRLQGMLRRARRVAVSYRVESRRRRGVMPAVEPVHAPTPALLPFVSPAPLFQSRSILVREFLATHVGPLLANGNTDLVQAIFDVTRRELKWAPDGKSFALDAIRRRRAKRIGIERAFTTFLRCARVPARFVEGIDLNSSTRRKRVFWTEVWAQGRWWPLSASRGWVGRLPGSYVALTRDGRRPLRAEEPVTATYTVQAHRLGEDT